MSSKYPDKITDLIFDLDDTLLNTSEDIVPNVVKIVFDKMKKNGLGLSFQTFEAKRTELAKSNSHREIFLQLAEEHCEDKKWIKACADAGTKAFYNPEIPDKLKLMPDAENVLSDCERNKYVLHLITSGVSATQNKKIKALGISQFFNSIQVVGFEPKTAAVQNVLSKRNVPASEVLSIGNRLSHEIRDSKSLGTWTCYFAFGEHLGEQPQTDFDKPDFQISNWKEFSKACPFLKLKA